MIRIASESEIDQQGFILYEFSLLTDDLQGTCRHPGAMIQRSEYLQQLIIQIYIKRLLLLDLTHAPHIHRHRFIIILSVSREHWQVRGDGKCNLVSVSFY